MKVCVLFRMSAGAAVLTHDILAVISKVSAVWDMTSYRLVWGHHVPPKRR